MTEILKKQEELEDSEIERDQCSYCGLELMDQETATCVRCDAKLIDGKVVVLDSKELHDQLKIIDSQLAQGYNGIMDVLDDRKSSYLELDWVQTDLHEMRDFMQTLYPVFRKLGLESADKALQLYHEKLDTILGDPGRKGE